MYRTGLLVICLTVVFAHHGPGEHRKCMRLMHPENMKCCKGFEMPNDEASDMTECLKIGPSCERATCFASKSGLASPDGTLNKQALLETLEKRLKDDPEKLEAAKEKCINGDTSKYGPPDLCDLMKVMDCVKLQMAFHCSEWENSGSCDGIKELVTECKEKLEE